MATAKRSTATKKTATGSRAKTTGKTQAAGKKNGARSPVSPEQRLKMIELAAYFAAEKSGFKGNSTEYWARAEKDVDAQLAGKK